MTSFDIAIGTVVYVIAYGFIPAVALGVVVILFALVYYGLWLAFWLYIRRMHTIVINWYDLAAWIRSGRPKWQMYRDSGGKQYHRMVPQDGPWSETPYIVSSKDNKHGK